jgi:hypothetical protein
MRPLCFFLFLFFLTFFVFRFLGGGRGCVGLTVGIGSTPGQVWLTAEATAEKGRVNQRFTGGTHTSPNGDTPRGECGFHGRYRFVGNLNSSVLPSTFYPSGSFLLFLLSYSVFLLFCSLFCRLCTVVVVPVRTALEHTLCFPACLLVLLVPCAFVSPSPPRRSLASHTRPLQRNSNVFSFGVHLSTQLPGFVSLALVSLERFVVASPRFWCWCARRRKEIFWNLSPSGLCASLPTILSLPRPSPPY